VGSTPCLLYTILCVVFEARVINLCDRDIATPRIVVTPIGTTLESFLYGSAPTGSFPLLMMGRLQTGVQIPPEDELAGALPLGGG
jgi:hypothetical protein